ncbi:MAG: enolase C-terminal domain-like protein [Armatimonadota bacterium]|nr:enolase C-terminal domain-like protein [Armatimonadota bacterium]MDR7488512.1 enolase C-terminal domain-like protein [Armatimonadota bacterium]MDR7573797.1 enolase C-terminal domain-like protein [Armatimonadota bacterium]
MRITSVRARAVRIPRRSVLTTSYGARDDATTVVVEVHTDEGVTGIGQTAVDAPFYGETAEGMLANIRVHLAPAVVGESPLDIERLNGRLRAALPEHWSSHAGVELALWDLKGKALGVPVYQLLGGRVRDGVDLMGFVRRSTPARMAQEAAATLAETPFPVLKMKIGIDPREDVAQYRAVAEAVGDRAVLQVDGNAGYTLSQALPTLAAMERIGRLGAIEQPVARLADLAEVARRFPVPVMADEAIYPPADALEVVEQRAASLALMKITKHGGILNVQKIAAVFEAAGLDLSVAIYYDVIAAAAAHIAAALPVVRWPSPATDLADTILTEPLEPRGLVLPVPEGPGFGVALDEDKMRRYVVDL